jgi:hypothetical protein
VRCSSRAARNAGTPIDNLDTFDPEREQVYNLFGVQFTFRQGVGAQLFGGLGFERDAPLSGEARKSKKL